jgi:hypothetical protein
MKHICKLACLSVLFAVFWTGAQAQEKPVTKIPTASDKTEAKAQAAALYKELLGKVQKGDFTVDFKALRFAFADSEKSPSLTEDKGARNKVFKALSDKKYKYALKMAEDSLKTVYVDANLHFVTYVANKGLGNIEKADFHKNVLTKILDSIQNGGDGKTAKTAFMVMDVDEEYTLLRFLGYQMQSQGLDKEDGHTFDVLTVINPKTQEIHKLYFNIDKIWAGYEKLLGK